MAHRPLPADNLFLKLPAYFPDRKHCPPVPACSSIRNLCYFPNYFHFAAPAWLRHLPATVRFHYLLALSEASALPSHFPASSGASVLSSYFPASSHHSSGFPSEDTGLRFPPALPDPGSFSQTGSGFRIPYGTGRCSRSHYISYLYMAPYQLISPFLFPINLCSPAKCCYNRCHLFLYTTALSHILFFLHYLHTLSLCPISYSTNISKTALTGASFLCLSNHQ